MVWFAAAAFAFAGCAHVKPASDDKDAAGPAPGHSLEQVLTQNLDGSKAKAGDSTPPAPTGVMREQGEISVRGIKLKNTKFDLPITINSRVEYWVDYFTGKGRPLFERYLDRSQYFIPYMQPLLRQNGMPQDLVYLAMIESGFNNLARSHASAVGPWQFISATGRRYGLMVNWWVDERRDVRKSTLAAVEYLRDLYNLFQSWELAAAAYNAGEAKVARAIQRYGSRDFWVLSKQRYLRPETRDYVPKIIAAALVAKNREQFGFAKDNTLRPGADEAISGDGELVKVIKTDKPLGDDPNAARPDDRPAPAPNGAAPTLISGNASDEAVSGADTEEDDDFVDGDDDDDSPDTGTTPATLTVPPPKGAPAPQMADANSAPMIQARPVPTPHVSKSGEVGGEELTEFEVQSPADLLKVARAAGLSYQTVKALNPELLRWCTPPGVGTFRLKLPASTKEKFLTTYNHDAFPRKVQFLSYKVRRGETIAHIAQHFGIKVDPISELNGISARTPLRYGARVILPIPNDRSRSLASLDVRDPPEHHRRHRRRRRSHYTRVTYKQRRESARAEHRHRRET